MMERLVIIALLGLFTLGYTAKCPEQKNSPGREIVCYTTTSDVKYLEDVICKCTTLIYQGHDIQSLTATDLSDLRKSLKEIKPLLQFVVSISDARGTLKTSANARHEAVARIFNILDEIDGVELNVTAGTKERLVHFVQGLKEEMLRKSKHRRILMKLPTKAEELAKQFDIKGLSKYVDLFTLPTHYLMGNDDKYKTFHPSRLMGLFDLLNTDSLVDLVHGLGAAKRKILVSLPASGYKFTLKIKDKNAAGDNTENEIPDKINRRVLCENILKGEWTIERDEDQTAPYAFKDNTWIAFEDKISVGIKAKYALLRDLAGLAINDIDNDLITDCGNSLSEYIYNSFTDNKRKTREAVLTALQDDIYNMKTSYPDNMKSSDYRISRIVDIDGKIHSIRENTQTEFSCNRQGYFVHPKSCNRFYRCVKFNQAIEDYSVFEFDCPAGLAFDERIEVCVWPGSISEGSPCPGSSEIAPTTPRRFRCPGPGYYADPRNCRWFFACIDLGEGRMMPYEFQCPYGLVFDENKFVCEWPWLVPECAGKNYAYNGGSVYGGYGGYDGYGEGGYDGYGGQGQGGYEGQGQGGYEGQGQGEYGGYDQPNIGSHGREPYGGHGGYGGSGEKGHGVYDRPIKGGDGSHGGSGDEGHGGYDRPMKGGRGGYGGSGEKGHGGYDEPNLGDHDGGSSYNNNHGHPEQGGHDGEYDHSNKSGHGGSEEEGHDGQHGNDHGPKDYDGHDRPNKSGPDVHEEPEKEHGGYDGESPHGDHEDRKESGHDEYDEKNKNHGVEYSQGNSEGFDQTHENEHKTLEHKDDNRGDGGYNYSHDGGLSHDNSAGEENHGPNEHGEGSSGGSYDAHSGQPGHNDYADKDEGVKNHVTQSDYGKQSVHGGYTNSEHTSDSYTTSSAHLTSSHSGFSSSDNEQHSTVGGAYTKGYPGPPTILFGSDGSQYTTAGQTYSISNKDQTTSHGYTSSIYRGDAGTSSDFNKGVTNQSFGTVKTSGETSSIIKNDINHDGNIISGITQSGYLQTQPGTSGYVVTNGVKTIYDGSAVPQTSLYDTTSSELVYGDKTASIGIIKGTTSPGVYIDNSGSTRDSTINTGNKYYTNQANVGYTGGETTKENIGFTHVVGSTITPGNQYYTNQAGTSYIGIEKGINNYETPLTPNIAITTNDGNYYNQPGYSQNIDTSRGTVFTPAVSVTSSGNEYYANQAGISSYDNNNNREIPIKSTVTGAYETNEYHDNGGRGTIRYNNGVVTHKYTEDDVRDHRTSFRIPPTPEVTQSDRLTPVSNGVYTKEGFTKTGPTKTGITTAQLGGTGTYVAGVSTSRPLINSDNIGENAFGTMNQQTSNINTQQSKINTFTYDKSNEFDNGASTQLPNTYEDRNTPVSSQSPLFNVHVYNTPAVLPSAPITASPAVVNTYSYANPTNVQYQENTFQSSKSSSNSASTGQYSNPFFTAQRKYPTVSPTVQPVGYTTAPFDNYKTTLFEAARIPIVVSTMKPIVDNGYKSVISSTPVSVPISAGDYDYNESTSLINSSENNANQLANGGISFQYSTTPTPPTTLSPEYSHRPFGQNFNPKVTPSVTYQQSTIEDGDETEFSDYTYDRTGANFGEKITQGESLSQDSIAYRQPTVTIQPQVYQRPSTIEPFQAGQNYQQSTSSSKENSGGGYKYPRPENEFIKSSTPSISYSTIRPIEANVSPANPSINRNQVEKLVTNYNNRGNIKYTAPGNYEERTSDSSYDEKSPIKGAMSNRIYTTPQPEVTTYSGNHRIISTTPRHEINKSTDIGRVKNNGKVIVKYSDLHPILLGKLGAECTCKANPFISFQGDKPLLIDSSKGKVDLRNYDESDVYVDLENSRETELQDYNGDYSNYRSSTQSSKISTHETPIVAVFNGIKSAKSQSQRPSPTYLPASTPCPPSTTSSSLRVSASDIEASASDSSGVFRSRGGRKLESSNPNTLPTFDMSHGYMNSKEIGVLEMSTEGEAKCARPGLFRHPKFCNKFYVCHWDEWKKKFSLNIFNCPIHLTFDSRASACNWPSKGPACQDDNIFV